MDPDPKSDGGEDIVDLRREDDRIRNGRGRSARMYHGVGLFELVLGDFLALAGVLEPIFVSCCYVVEGSSV